MIGRERVAESILRPRFEMPLRDHCIPRALPRWRIRVRCWPFAERLGVTVNPLPERGRGRINDPIVLGLGDCLRGLAVKVPAGNDNPPLLAVDPFAAETFGLSVTHPEEILETRPRDVQRLARLDLSHDGF